jgi:hypothetical protein
MIKEKKKYLEEDEAIVRYNESTGTNYHADCEKWKKRK